jgi:hypothetical protein
LAFAPRDVKTRGLGAAGLGQDLQGAAAPKPLDIHALKCLITSMIEKALSPVERGILVILMAQGKPVKQTDFKAAHGLSVGKQHRDKLHSLGLIEVGKNPITYSLTPLGWAWFGEQVAGAKPKGAADAPLHAALFAIDRLVKRLGLPLKEAFGQTIPADEPAPLDEKTHDVAATYEIYIREAAWSEADTSLAKAIQNIPQFTVARDSLKEAVNGSIESKFKRLELTSKLVLESLQQAAANRQMSVVGISGEEIDFQPSIFDCGDEKVKVGAKVLVRKPAVTRGEGNNKVIIRQGTVQVINA